MLKHFAANRKRRLSALPNVSPYIYDVKIFCFTRTTLVGYGLRVLKNAMEFIVSDFATNGTRCFPIPRCHQLLLM
jgi:hypothetical protein